MKKLISVESRIQIPTRHYNPQALPNLSLGSMLALYQHLHPAHVDLSFPIV